MGNDSLDIGLSIVNDEILEPDEEFSVSIPDIPECRLVFPSSAIVTIIDDDGMC